MSVTSCKLIPDGQSASQDGTCTESWRITTTHKLDHPLLFVGALQAEGYLPYKGSGHWLNPYLRSTGPKVVREGRSMFHWIATSEYKIVLSEKEEQEVQREQEPNPLSRRPRITKSYDRFEIAISENKDGKAILNAAGDPWLDPVLVARASAIWSVSHNYAASPTWMDSLAGHTNSDSFVVRGITYPPGSLLFEPGDESEQQEEAGQQFYTASFRLLVDTIDLWKEKRIENGLNEKVDGVKRKIKLPTKDSDGNPLDYDDPAREPVSDPQLIDEDGKLIENPSTASAKHVEIDKYPRTAFNGVLPELNF